MQRPSNEGDIIKDYQAVFVSQASRTDTISRSKAAVALQWPKAVAEICHIPWPVENDLFPLCDW
jgi:hypothetical protein